jgi:FMN phosphatase YigB (HAD superfamily)
VPELDLVLAETPAEIDDLVSPPCGEIHEPLVRVLDERTEAVDRVHAPRQRLQLFRDPLVELHGRAWIDAAAVARNLDGEPASQRAGIRKRATVLDELLCERTNLVQQRVRFLEREDAFGHRSMIENDVTAGQRVELADLDAVTLDAYGTLLELDDPVASLSQLVPDREREDVERAFREEAAYYVAHSHEGRDPETLAKLRAHCTGVFNQALGSSVTPEQFVGALRFVFLPGAVEAAHDLRKLGLEVAVVSNWDVELHVHLASLEAVVVTSADVGVAKPDPSPLLHALQRLGVSPARALHVGDSDADREAAAAAGTRFAPAPLREVVAQWK